MYLSGFKEFEQLCRDHNLSFNCHFNPGDERWTITFLTFEDGKGYWEGPTKEVCKLTYRSLPVALTLAYGEVVEILKAQW